MMNTQCERPRLFSELGKRGSKIFLNRYFYLFIFCLACAVTALGREVFGAVLFVLIICVCLVLSDDIATILLPFLLMCVFLTKCYDSSSTFIKFAWLIVPVVGAFAFHFIAYRREFSVGRSFWGLLAVSAAVAMGGISWISGYEYFTVTSFYYMNFLGVGMVGIYLAIKSQLTLRRDYDIREQLIKVLYIMGIFACFMILLNNLPRTTFAGGIKLVADFQPANNLSTFMTFAMPCPFFFVKKSRMHIFAPFLMLFCMFISGSRGGVLFGTIELVICLFASAIWDKPRRFFYVCAAVGFVAFVAVFKNSFIAILQRTNVYPFVKDNEVRKELIKFSLDRFKKNPIFGHGLGYTGFKSLYSPKTGAMAWYHMMIPQIIGSMGLVGIAAYLYQGINQLIILFKNLKKEGRGNHGITVTLGLSYLGILMMSQVNPGLFCPLPYYLIAVIIFATMDGEDGFDGIKRLYSKIAEKREAKRSAKSLQPEDSAETVVESASESSAEPAVVEAPAPRAKVVAKRITKKKFEDHIRK